MIFSHCSSIPVLVVILTFTLAAAELKRIDTPKFEDYFIANVYKEKNVPLILTKDDRLYRTRLRLGARGKVNFAGHYVLVIWGCGASCRMGAAIDAVSGRVHWLPGTVCCWDTAIEEDPSLGDSIVFHADSNLLILSGLINERGVNGVHYFKFEAGHFTHLLTIPQAQINEP